MMSFVSQVFPSRSEKLMKPVIVQKRKEGLRASGTLQSFGWTLATH